MPRCVLRLTGLGCLLALGSLAVARSLAAQELPVFGTRVTVVTLPVFVTDKSGRAVAGLTAGDFEIEDQGTKVPLVAFQAVDASSPEPAAEAGMMVQAAARRQFLLLFDLTFSTPVGIMRARQAAIDFVRGSLAPSDLAAAATFSQAGIQVLVSFTTDRAQLARAISTLGVVDTQRLRDPLSLAYDLGLDRSGPGIGPPSDNRLDEYLRQMAQQQSRSEQTLYRQRVDGFLAGLGQLARALDAVEGRKQVVLLSAGFDSTVLGGAQGQEAADAAQAAADGRLWEVQSDRYFGDSVTRDSLDRLFQSLAATDTVIHTVDVGGLAAGGAVDQAVPGRLAPGRDTLAQFAANTGGRFIKDANDIRAGLVELLDASRHYYVLAFEPLEAGRKPGRLRKIEVRVRGSGLEVSHRKGYVIPDAKRDVVPEAGRLQAAETIAKGLSGGPIALRAVAVPYRDAKGDLSLPVVLEIDGRTLLGEGASNELSLEVFGYAFDGEGRIHDAVGLARTLDLGAVRSVLQAKGLQVLTSFAVTAGPVDLRFAVREKTTARGGSLRVRLEMPAFEAGKIVLSPPLAMDDPRTRLVMPAASRALPALAIPFRLADTPFTAEPLPLLRNGAELDVCVMAWGGEARYGGGPSYEIDAEILDPAGEARDLPLAGPPRVVQDADGLERYVLTLAPREVPAGRYALRVRFRDPATAATGRSEIAVQLE
jgi:VWFA-related protein